MKQHPVIASEARQSSYCELRLAGLPRRVAPRNDGSGFTLVELSIVLVIIGLLIGGILVAQSMIGTAKIQAQIRQLQQLSVAAQNFVTKFNRLPGDANKDGWIEDWVDDGSQPQAPCSYMNGECANIFVELSQMGRLPGNYVFPSPGSLQIGQGNTFPSAVIRGAGIFGRQNTMQQLYWGIGPDKGCTYMVGYHDQRCQINAFTPTEALAIDTKIDDGNGYTGNVASIFKGGLGGNDFISETGPATCTNTCLALRVDDSSASTYNCSNRSDGSYKISNKNSECSMQFNANVNYP